ncbi:MAG TPA: metallophosphoesterase [Gaiellaceae bacterium]|nr:metallophosphoesterase [Gaiellaceae bacterium]
MGRRTLVAGVAVAAVCGGTSGAGSAVAAAAPAQVFVPFADGFVAAGAPRANHGRARALRLQARPSSRAYLRFRVGRLRGAVVSSRLRVFAVGRGTVEVRAAARRYWNERSLTYRTAPRLGRVVASGPARPGWNSFEVGSLVVGPGTVDLALVARRGTVSVASRETGSSPTLSVETAPVLLAAGDVGSCNSGGDEATAALLGGVPATVAALGDLAYPKGTADEFASCYDPSWGRFRPSTRPAAGNHDYATPGAAAYFDYFGAAAGLRGAGYYSYDLGSWHVVVLNSNCRFVACGAGSLQETWLRHDLAEHRAPCTLAYFHHPLFSSTAGTATPAVRPLWQALYDAGADVVLGGHAHNYQRFAPQTPSGAADPARGIREFVVGTGGNSLRFVGPPIANQETADDTTYGVLRLTLLDAGYRWSFVPVAGGAFDDSGAATCH